MKRSRMFVTGLALVAGVLFGTANAVGAGFALGHHVRFDIVQFAPLVNQPQTAAVLAGGTAVGADRTAGDRVELTGSGEVKAATGAASGGGTFVHKHGTKVVETGVYLVSGFVSWQPAGGTLPGSLADGIGETAEATAGILTVTVRLLPTTGANAGASIPGTLAIHCELPGASFAIEEGIQLAFQRFEFEQAGGGTLLHLEH